jgi:hypothetical protein
LLDRWILDPNGVAFGGEVVAMPMWLIIAIAIAVFLVLMMGLAFAWSKWMTRSGAPDN